MIVHRAQMCLPDHSIAYDVMIKKKAMEEAINLATWHTTCNNGLLGKNQIRQIELETLPVEKQICNDTTDVRRLGGKRFVIEERLNQFGKHNIRGYQIRFKHFGSQISGFRQADTDAQDRL